MAQTTEGIDVPAKLKASSEGDECTMATVVKLAERQSVAHGNMAEERAFELRREFGARGLSSLVVIHNRTAARLTLDRHSNRAGSLHEKSCLPTAIDPGSNGAFLHVGNKRDRKVASKGLLVYSIDVFDEGREDWKESAFSLAFSWETGAYGGYVGVKFESARERTVHHTKTRYDGQRILGEANVKKSPVGGVFVVTFSQKDVDERSMPLSSKVVDFFQTAMSRRKSETAQEEKNNEEEIAEKDGVEAEAPDQIDQTVSREDTKATISSPKGTTETEGQEDSKPVKTVSKDTVLAEGEDVHYMYEV